MTNRLLRVVRSTLAIHVALSNERSLSFPVADCSENLGREVDGAVVADRRRSRVDNSLNDALVRPSCVGRIGKLQRTELD